MWFLQTDQPCTQQLTPPVRSPFLPCRLLCPSPCPNHLCLLLLCPFHQIFRRLCPILCPSLLLSQHPNFLSSESTFHRLCPNPCPNHLCLLLLWQWLLTPMIPHTADGIHFLKWDLHGIWLSNYCARFKFMVIHTHLPLLFPLCSKDTGANCSSFRMFASRIRIIGPSEIERLSVPVGWLAERQTNSCLVVDTVPPLVPDAFQNWQIFLRWSIWRFQSKPIQITSTQSLPANQWLHLKYPANNHRYWGKTIATYFQYGKFKEHLRILHPAMVSIKIFYNLPMLRVLREDYRYSIWLSLIVEGSWELERSQKILHPRKSTATLT